MRIPLCEPYIKGNEWKYIKDCLDTNWVSSVGTYVNKFEELVSDYIGVNYGVATVNGTAAIHTALMVLGVGPGDKVLVPSLTFIASVNPICYCGAEPVFIDSEVNTFNIDPEKTIDKIEQMVKKGNKPKAVIVVHLYGHPADIDPIAEVCKKYDIKLIEDATEALGSKYKGRMVGSLGDIACFSFNGNKLITTGGGGMLVTNNKKWADHARYLIQQAKDDPENFIHNNIGYNYRLTNIQAALGVAQFENIEEFIESKRTTAMTYNKLLSKIPGITVNPEMEWAYNCFWLYSILIDEKEFGINSKTLLEKLNLRGVMARPFFKPLHHMPMFRKYDADIHVADWLWERGLNLPCSVGITLEEIQQVVDTICEIREEK
ncbi:hypothetical protein BBF96_11110 [Anoxybacter fermentans]|uniref:Aminotransferase DegT n=1 Tax=Anoxybacter fermentans TaxID=1323375 RepID=A0A3Q9HR44_9FIRM|nr:LegC family aminotransferase [Anoxybacter fermentans]AZR73888.1 hypothetical protein BBF96_11110 [Anoxybacter fermentans]